MKKLGYARVSTVTQDLQIQLDYLKDKGCDIIFQEKQSGATTENRKQLHAMLECASEGDTVYFVRLDRMGRSTIDNLIIVKNLLDRKINVHVGNLGDLNNAMAKVMLTVFSAFAEHERMMILERTAEGRNAALARGVKFGRKRTVTKEQEDIILLMKDEQGKTFKEIGAVLKMSRNTISTVYKRLYPERYPSAYKPRFVLVDKKDEK